MDKAPSRTPRYWAVVAAAGGGSRMQTPLPKQYLPLRGKTLIEHSLAVLRRIVADVVLVGGNHDRFHPYN